MSTLPTLCITGKLDSIIWGNDVVFDWSVYGVMKSWINSDFLPCRKFSKFGLFPKLDTILTEFYTRGPWEIALGIYVK